MFQKPKLYSICSIKQLGLVLEYVFLIFSARCPENSAALYEFIKGNRVEAVGTTEILLAAKLIEKINQHRENKMFRALPHAAEACFSLKEHVGSVDRRIDRLSQME